MEGIITIVVGTIGAVTIADFPEHAANKTKSLAMPFLNQKVSSVHAIPPCDHVTTAADSLSYIMYMLTP